MEAYELEPDKIINWAVEFAGYDELEQVAKSVYSIYKSRQRTEKPHAYKNAKAYKRHLKKKGRRHGK